MDKSPVQSEAALPLVSVVIPTHGRPVLLLRALRTVLDQTLRQLEAIVVVDGLDAATTDALSRITDSRVHVLALERNVGGSEARNIGVRYARAKWIAFLDDDDEWFPTKLERQWELGESVSGCSTIVASKFIERTETVDRILPMRIPVRGETMSDYLFVRKGWNSGEGFLQTSTWFVTRELLLLVRFTKGLKRCQDLDWLLHAASLAETKLIVSPEVLAVFHHDEHGVRVSREADWRFLFNWAEGNRKYFSRNAFSFLVATMCVPSASKQRAGIRTFFFLLGKCVPCGAATAKCLALFMICWWVPEGSRRNLRAWAGRLRSVFEPRIALAPSPSAPGKVA
jgi:glycosyltransferase involved in cell wall biosynthesis